jgi:hypothetical protein
MYVIPMSLCFPCLQLSCYKQFTAPDLSDIAHQLDELEDNYNEDHRLATTSNNMDDTGMYVKFYASH